MWLDADEVLRNSADSVQQVAASLPPDAAGAAVKMVLCDAEGAVGSVMHNTKLIRRGVRFVRRRHEHINDPGAQIMHPEIVIHHLPSQRRDVRRAHDARKLQYEAFIADWEEFKDGRAAFYCGDWWRCQGHPWEAIAWLEMAVNMPPDKCPGPQRALCALTAARIYIERKQPDRAYQLLHKVLELDWRMSEAYYWLGVIAANSKRLEEAELYLNMALQYEGRSVNLMQQAADVDALALFGLASVAAERGDRARAYELLRQAQYRATGPHPEFQVLYNRLDKEGWDG